MKSITIGREDTCDIIIDNERVSRTHAGMVPVNDGFLYRDMSSNGTIINGTWIRNDERFVHFGDQVLLAGNIPLPWNRVREKLSSPNGNYGHGPTYTDRPYYPPVERPYVDERYGAVTYKDGIALIIFGYILALLGGWLAFVLGSILVNSKQTTPNGRTVKKYSPAAVTNGWVIIGIAIFSTIIYLIIIINSK